MHKTDLGDIIRIGKKHRFDLSLYYDCFNHHHYTKYWPIPVPFDLGNETSTTFSEIELPFACRDIGLGKTINYFFTTDGMVIIHSDFLSEGLTKQENSIVMNSKNPNPPFYILDMKKVVKKALEKEQPIENPSYEVKRVTNDYSSIYIETTDGLLIRVGGNDVVAYPYLRNRIKILTSSTFDSSLLVVTFDDTLFFFTQGSPRENPDFQHGYEIVLAAVGPDAVAIVTKDNVLHTMGPNTYGSCGGGGNWGFTQFNHFEKKIISVKCGYLHMVLLFEDGSLMSTGYNNLKQCLVLDSDSLGTFTAPSMTLKNTSMGM